MNPQHESHPRGLYTLFGAEAWERFSYYGMRALLVLYMVNHLKMARGDALEVYAFYTGLVYLTPIAGGWIADKLLGRRKAVLIGGLVMALGHLAMAFEPLLVPALGLLIVGNGFFKPNISTIVGGLYEENDPRRDGGFTIFYMGINLGAFFSPIVCGNLGEKIGWHWGFSAAAVGMVLGLAQFVHGQKHLARIGLPPRATGDRLVKRDYVDVALWVVAASVLVFVLIAGGRAAAPLWGSVPGAAKTVLALAAAAFTLLQLYRGATREEAERITVIVVLCLFNVFFWMGFEQGGGTLALFADENTNRVLSGAEVIAVGAIVALGAANIRRDTRDETSGRALWTALIALFAIGGAGLLVWGATLVATHQTTTVASSQFQAINPLIIVVLAPTFSRLWERLDSGRFKTSTPTKMALGMIILGLGFVVMAAGAELAKRGPVSPAWLTSVFTIHTIGELCLSPIGLSMVTKLAPPRVVSLAMGMWFFSSAVANYLAGTLESMLEHARVPIYPFLITASIAPALLLLVLRPLLARWMHGRA